MYILSQPTTLYTKCYMKTMTNQTVHHHDFIKQALPYLMVVMLFHKKSHLTAVN